MDNTERTNTSSKTETSRLTGLTRAEETEKANAAQATEAVPLPQTYVSMFFMRPPSVALVLLGA